MPETFVLIHGAWHTGEDFETIANILRGAGHTVYCPTLRGNRPPNHPDRMICTGYFEITAASVAPNWNRILPL
jgi:esterase/lipase